MLTIQQKAQRVFWYPKMKSPTTVQRKFKNEFGQDPPHTNSIKSWFKKFFGTGSILNCERSGRPTKHILLQTYAFIKNDLFLPILTMK